MTPLHVMVVDDSAVMRQTLGSLLGAAPGVGKVTTVPDAVRALERMAQAWPDVIVLDLEMPHMDGLSFLRQVMRDCPTPIVICSTLAEEGARVTLDALAAGAVTVVAKPRFGLRQHLVDTAAEFVAVVLAAATARVSPPQRVASALPTPPATSPPSARRDAGAALRSRSAGLATPASYPAQQIVVMGTSTGGTQALEAILPALPPSCPGLVIVQHMPAQFTAAFAARLSALCQIDVREAQNHDAVVPGRALIAPGGRHTFLRRQGAAYHVIVKEGPLVNRHRPSVDVLFRSASRVAGPRALGILMTGMGDDGAAGLLEMRQAGARTLAQDEASSVVFGMPKEALARGAAERAVPLPTIAREILAWARAGRPMPSPT
jgi:two-component system chemotaxis response regulator CheB